MFAAARDPPKRPIHIQTHTHPLSSADVSVVGRETYDRYREKWKLRKIQITLLSELRGLVSVKSQKSKSAHKSCNKLMQAV